MFGTLKTLAAACIAALSPMVFADQPVHCKYTSTQMKSNRNMIAFRFEESSCRLLDIRGVTWGHRSWLEERRICLHPWVAKQTSALQKPSKSQNFPTSALRKSVALALSERLLSTASQSSSFVTAAETRPQAYVTADKFLCCHPTWLQQDLKAGRLVPG